MELKHLLQKAGEKRFTQPLSTYNGYQKLMLITALRDPAMFEALLKVWTPDLEDLLVLNYNDRPIPLESIQALLDAGVRITERCYYLAARLKDNRVDIVNLFLTTAPDVDTAEGLRSAKKMDMLELLLPRASKMNLHYMILKDIPLDGFRHLIKVGLEKYGPDVIMRKSGAGDYEFDENQTIRVKDNRTLRDHAVQMLQTLQYIIRHILRQPNVPHENMIRQRLLCRQAELIERVTNIIAIIDSFEDEIRQSEQVLELMKYE